MLNYKNLNEDEIRRLRDYSQKEIKALEDCITLAELDKLIDQLEITDYIINLIRTTLRSHNIKATYDCLDYISSEIIATRAVAVNRQEDILYDMSKDYRTKED